MRKCFGPASLNMAANDAANVKLVFVGDAGVGKSCFLIGVTTSHFEPEYIPTVFDISAASLTINGSTCLVGLWDTSGQSDYDRLRPLAYPDTDVFVVCFDVANRSSFRNVTLKWIPEIHYHAGSPITLLLATKTDLRDGNNASPDSATVSTREGKALARSLGVSYAECSLLTNDGVQAALEKAAKLAVEKNVTSKIKGFFRRRNKNSTSVDQELPLPPDLPPAGFAPQIEVLSSTFATDLHSMMSDTKSADVRLLFSDGQSVEAHKTVLSASSSIFLSTMCTFEDISWVHNESNHPNPVDIEGHHQCQNEGKTVIRLHESISKAVFLKVLAFLYTGSPDISEDEDKNFVKEIQVVAEKFQLAMLSDICTNLLEGDSFRNLNIGSWLNDNLGQAVKHLFLNKPFQADVKFRVEGSIVYGHRTILNARSEVMAAMLGGAFRESDLDTEIEIKDASLQSFLALLEYLYTDHAPIEEGDSVEMMILADRFCLPRLVTLCELYIAKNVDLSFRERVADGTSDVINLLLISQAHNAEQLSRWCLHFISTNFSVFESTEEFDLVQGENRKHINEHRWPPLSFLEAQKEYERKVRKLNSKCNVM